MDIQVPEIKFDPNKLRLVDPKTLTRDPNNRNKHSKEQIDRFCKLLQTYGMRWPILVSEQTGVIKAGEGRLLAALQLGMPQVLVSYQNFESSEIEYGFGISDNAIAHWAQLDLSAINTDLGELGPDFDIDLLGIKDFKITRAEKLPYVGDEESVPTPREYIVKPGDVWEMEGHRLVCGDCTNLDDVEKLFRGGRAELCFTSPPYADQREYGGGLDLSTEHLATFIRASAHLCRYFAINLGMSRKDNQVNPYWDDYIKEAKECNLLFLSWNIWNRGEAAGIGNQTAMFAISHEWILVFGPHKKELNRTIPNKYAGAMADHNSDRQQDGSIKKRKDRFVNDFSQLKTVYDCTAHKARDDINHPARFPVALPEGYIEAMTDPGDVVYEPFGGSGSTLIAAEKTGRFCFISEIDPRYCDTILSRWIKFSGKTAYLVQTSAGRIEPVPYANVNSCREVIMKDENKNTALKNAGQLEGHIDESCVLGVENLD